MIVDDDSQGTEAHLSTTTAMVSGPDSASHPASLSNPTEFKPDHSDWSVEHNPEIGQALSLHVADTFTFKDTVYCTKFSRDGQYLAIGLAMERHTFMT
jgi:hypothetical protein